MTKKVICDSCGAEFDNNEPKCPYCGTMNYDGAEKEYFEKLENIHTDMEDLKTVSAEETKKEFKKQGSFINKVLIVALVIGLLLVGTHILSELSYERDEKEDFLWKSENYPVMDAMYEAEEYDELLEFYMQALEEDRPVYQWEHYAFIDTYYDVKEFYNCQEDIDNGENVWESTYRLAFSKQWWIMGAALGDDLTEEEKTFFAEDFKVVEEHLKNDWDLDEATYQKFYEEAVRKGYVDYEHSEAYVKEWLKGKE